MIQFVGSVDLSTRNRLFAFFILAESGCWVLKTPKDEGICSFLLQRQTVSVKPIYLSLDTHCLLFKLAKLIRQPEMKPYHWSCQVPTIQFVQHDERIQISRQIKYASDFIWIGACPEKSHIGMWLCLVDFNGIFAMVVKMRLRLNSLLPQLEVWYFKFKMFVFGDNWKLCAIMCVGYLHFHFHLKFVNTLKCARPYNKWAQHTLCL